MRSLLAALIACAALCAAPPPARAATEPQVRAEIDELLAALEGSGCEFGRNGAWYPPAEAKSHLLRKLDYIEGRTSVKSAEQFIDLAATKSSISGQPYVVKCAGAAPQESSKWLAARLATIRASKAAPARK